MASLPIWRWRFVLLLAVLSVSLLKLQAKAQAVESQEQSPSDSVESHLGNGYEALREEKYDTAEKEFRRALALDPRLLLRARFPLAVALFEQHKFTESREEFETVRRSAGDEPAISYYLGRLDLEDRNYKSAIVNLRRASARPPFQDTAFYLGLAYVRQGSNQEAEKWFKEALRLNPRESRAEYQLGTMYRKEGRQEEANEAFRRSKQSIARSDRRSQLKRECGEELDQRASSQATSACEQLNDPNDADMLTDLGILYGQHGQLEKALPLLQRAAELSPQSPQMQYNLAFTYFQMRRFQEARGPLEGALQRWHDLFPLNALYGAVLWNLGEVLPAYQALRHAHLLNVQDANTAALLYQSTLAMAKRSEDAGADSEALRYLREATALAPNDPEPKRRIAEIYRRTGKPERENE
jgi:tetratricopeptide (TPR) repeat protein